jgi:SAM-dependent methyltransferase
VQSRLASGTIVEIGGSLAGLQFVLAREGYDVINVDPGLAAKGRGWEVPGAAHEYIAKIFRAPARLIPTTLDHTGLPAHSVDLVLTISTLEHLTAGELDVVADSIRQLLKPGGPIVMTVDLFLDLAPFTAVQRNKWGTNIDIQAFLTRAGVELIAGDPRQIFGFPGFDREAIARNRESFLMGGDASLAQCLVARTV